MNKQTVTRELSSIGILKELANAYEEIAANNMRKIRNTVVRKRDFLSEITTMYNEVRSTYKKELLILLKNKKISSQSMFALLKKNDKTAYVFLSTNASLYGSIAKDTYKLLSEYLTKEDADIVIIGKIGKHYFELGYPNKTYTYFDFPEANIDTELFKNIILHIAQYERVIVLHSKFDTIVKQKPVGVTLVGNEKNTEYIGEKIQYLFDPGLDKVITFFEKEIFASIFEQIIRESDLSKYASRMTLLEKTLQNIEESTKKLKKQERVLSHQAFNKSQQSTLSSISLWKK